MGYKLRVNRELAVRLEFCGIGSHTISNRKPAMTTHSLDLLQNLIAQALRAGADAADALAVEGVSQSVSWRGGRLESLEQAEGSDLGLRVLIGKKQAIVSTSDRRPETIRALVERAVAMAKAAPEDEFCGLAPEDAITKEWPELPMADAYSVSTERLIEQARTAEESALAVKGVAQCESAGAGASYSTMALVASNGFAGSHRHTGYSIGVSVLAGEGTAMETDHDHASCVFQEDLPDAALIGRRAGELTVKKLGARKMPTCQAPVVFDPRESRGLVGCLAGAISGSSIARGTSFLKDSLGKTIFPSAITIVDDPFRARGLRSRTFDGEGLLPSRRNIIDKGVLTTWFLDMRSARQLKMKSTGHASRGVGGLPSPSPSNLYLEAGDLSPADLIRDIKQGFYVTNLMGMGINGVTGDYSQAASGFWIENGVIAFPVHEVTIAGNLKDMFLHMTAADDLLFRYGMNAPTLRIEGMTIAGF